MRGGARRGAQVRRGERRANPNPNPNPNPNSNSNPNPIPKPDPKPHQEEAAEERLDELKKSSKRTLKLMDRVDAADAAAKGEL